MRGQREDEPAEDFTRIESDEDMARFEAFMARPKKPVPSPADETRDGTMRLGRVTMEQHGRVIEALADMEICAKAAEARATAYETEIEELRVLARELAEWLERKTDERVNPVTPAAITALSSVPVSPPVASADKRGAR